MYSLAAVIIISVKAALIGYMLGRMHGRRRMADLYLARLRHLEETPPLQNRSA